MKIIRIVPFVLGAALSFGVTAATMVTTTKTMDPVTGVWHMTTDAATGVWHATTGVVGGVGHAATGLWDGAVHGTKTVVHHTTTKMCH